MGSIGFFGRCTSYSVEKSNQCDWQLQDVAFTMFARWGNSFFRHFYAGKLPCRNAIIPAKYVFTGLLYTLSLNSLAGVCSVCSTRLSNAVFLLVHVTHY